MRGERASRRSEEALLNNNERNKNNHEGTHGCRTAAGARLRMTVGRWSEDGRTMSELAAGTTLVAPAACRPCD